jgi:hypothetical protein
VQPDWISNIPNIEHPCWQRFFFPDQCVIVVTFITDFKPLTEQEEMQVTPGLQQRWKSYFNTNARRF